MNLTINQITKLLLLTPLIILVCIPVSLNAQSEQNWELVLDGRHVPIDVDYNNNLLLFKCGEDEDYSKTWLIKCSNTSTIVFNTSLDINYDYFHLASKKIDSEGNLFLIAKNSEKIFISKYNEQLNFIDSITIESGETFSDFLTSDVFITNRGSIFLRYTNKYEIINETHIAREDGLYKINADGSINWQLFFNLITRRYEPTINCITEDQTKSIFFSYFNKIYEINSDNGKISWEEEKEGIILDLVSVYGEVCILYKKFAESTALNVELISSKGKTVWEKKLVSEIGNLFLQDFESKMDKILIKTVDSNSDLITDAANESLILYNSCGDLLLQKSIYSDMYFLHQRRYYLTHSNSYYEYHYNSSIDDSSFTTLKLHSYFAPTCTPNKVSGWIFSTALLTSFIFLSKMHKRRKASHSYN